jgi:hypothetical protein
VRWPYRLRTRRASGAIGAGVVMFWDGWALARRTAPAARGREASIGPLAEPLGPCGSGTWHTARMRTRNKDRSHQARHRALTQA